MEVTPLLRTHVPTCEGEGARALLEDNRIKYAGLHEWSIEDGILVTHSVKTLNMEYDHRVS